MASFGQVDFVNSWNSPFTVLNMTEQEINRFPHSTLVIELGKRNLSTSGNTHILKKRLKQNVACSTKEVIQQSYEFLAIIDFEATCMENPPPPQHYVQEIIEFPIVLIDVTQQRIIDTFHSYCRPIIHPILSDYCKKLTRIAQEQVNSAPVFAEVFANAEKWLNDRELLPFQKRKCLFVTDSPSDFNKYLSMQCNITNIVYPMWAHRWVNIKTTFSAFYSTTSGRIRNMLEQLGLRLEGHLHSGLDDAINIARIVIELIKDGCLLAPNEFYHSSTTNSRERERLPTMEAQSSRMVCLNCSRSHSETQRSCLRYENQHRQNGTCTERKRKPVSRYSFISHDQSGTPLNISSLLEFPLLNATSSVPDVDLHHNKRFIKK
ncbi:unnamed protein product [Rotaria magnacalcarata]|uniref:Exonuclease domain-containing protein n=3 Tax=Rotaria magnacalcarata TaxID=392030 RepID=A0A816YPH2_9BILA|nr:unnamed protein product [Rotaria magnacalcarata]